MREELIKLLTGICPEVDFENEKALIDDGLLDSHAVLSILAAVSETYDVEFEADDIMPETITVMGCGAVNDVSQQQSVNYSAGTVKCLYQSKCPDLIKVIIINTFAEIFPDKDIYHVKVFLNERVALLYSRVFPVCSETVL